jgi:phenylacetate-coenzyme A ligase PaaK-like adenylate-forming protein
MSMDMETNMSNLTRLEIDAITGKKTVIAYTAEEIAEHDAMVAKIAADEKAKEDAIIAKAALLTKLGIDADEAKLLLS